jgi:hypothetical protein
MLVPGGGLVQAAINIYNAILFFMDRAKQIGDFVQNLTSSFASIAKGDIKGALKTIETVLVVCHWHWISWLLRLI